MLRDLDLGDRAKALEQLGVNRLGHAAIVGVVKEVLPETQAGLLVGSRQWPLLVHRMDQIRDHGGTGLLAAHLARLGTDTTWKDGPPSTTAGRLVDAALHSLTTPRPRPGSGSPRRRPVRARPPPRPPWPPGSRLRRKPWSPLTGSRPRRPGARGVRGDGGGSAPGCRGRGVHRGGVTWGRGPRSQGVNTYRGAVICGVAVSAAVLPISFAASAGATDVVGVGNSAHDNHCTNRGGPLASAATAYAAGVVSALTAAVPLSIATNQCGGLGAPLIDQEVQNVENCSALLGASQCAGNNFQTGGSFSGGAVSGGGALG
ncbi:hypothetical protein [Streptomyces sp. NPDC058613]|uniref:hypothetical protein n=1 Tax=unclassified Streptomyces TaxID=2593676 RepID=UPI0036582636